MASSDRAAARQRIEQQAADFVAAIADDPDGRAAVEAEEWIRRSPYHAVAFAKAERAWEAAGVIAQTGRDPPLADAALIEGANDDAESPAAHRSASAPTRRKILAGAVAACAAAIGGSWWLMGRQSIRTAVGELREVALADGSKLRLNTDSQVVVAIGDTRRLIRLEQGEAYFDVAHNPEVPFDVEVRGAVMRALGTAFNVRVRPDNIELTVAEGVVGIIDPQGAVRKITAGGVAFIQHQTIAVATLGPDMVDQRTAWRERAIEFDGTSLALAVAEVNRYRDQPVVIVDDRIASLRIGGRFHTDDTDAFLAALYETLPVTSRTAEDGSILLLYREDERSDTEL